MYSVRLISEVTLGIYAVAPPMGLRSSSSALGSPLLLLTVTDLFVCKNKIKYFHKKHVFVLNLSERRFRRGTEQNSSLRKVKIN